MIKNRANTFMTILRNPRFGSSNLLESIGHSNLESPKSW